MKGVTVVGYAKDARLTAAMLSDVLGRKSDINIELILIDGGSMSIDFGKIHVYCKERGIEFTVVRQEPVDSPAVGFHVAVKQAKCSVVACVDSNVSLPETFLQTAYTVGSAGNTWLLRSALNVALESGEVRTAIGPPSPMGLVFPTVDYDTDVLGDIAWKQTPWPKADAYILASKLATKKPRTVRMASLGGCERRGWFTQATTDYALVAAGDQSDDSRHIYADCDAARVLRGDKWLDIGSAVRPYQTPEEISAVVTSAAVEAELGTVDDSNAADKQLMFMSTLAKRFLSGQLMLLPICELVKDAANVYHVKSTGKMYLPFEY